MDNEIALSNADYRLLDIVWDAQPIASPKLCHLAEVKLGWKRTTTYTVIKRLCEKGYLKSENTIVTSLIGRQQARRAEGRQVLDHSFNGSLPEFVAAFLDGGTVSDKEAREIERLLEEYWRKP
ncbi:MAG: BlaI/MecI/CopY family transcriptional regulator [Oscillospiraceae bacterium]